MVTVLCGDNPASMTSWAARGHGDTEAKHSSLVPVTSRRQGGFYPHSFPGVMADTDLQGTMTMPALLTHVGNTASMLEQRFMGWDLQFLKLTSF